MNTIEEKYSKYALVKEMLETSSIVKNFNPHVVDEFVVAIKQTKGLFFTGEGSSRLFPAKRAIYSALKRGYGLNLMTDASIQSKEYNLDDYAVFVASNSGQTKEAIGFCKDLKSKGHNYLFGLTANEHTKLEEIVDKTHILSCGKEDAVAATKSVVEQGLFYDALLRGLTNGKMEYLDKVSAAIEEALTVVIDPAITEKMKKSEVIYFAGRNNGVAEELALKTNEITRKRSNFLEGTFALHGIEEIMNKGEVLVWVDPYEEEEENFMSRLVKNVGVEVIAISSRDTIFPTIKIPDCGDYAEYIQLATGWNILVETGVALGINLDKPTRARKIGNEYIESK